MKPKEMFKVLKQYNDVCKYVEEKPKAIMFEGKNSYSYKIFSTYGELQKYIKQEYIDEWIKAFENADFTNGIFSNFTFYMKMGTNVEKEESSAKLTFVNK